MAENNFFLNNGYDPLLQGGSDPQLQERLEALRRNQSELLAERESIAERKSVSIWDKIDAEINPLTDGQKNVMFSDPEYQQNEARLMEMVQSEMIAMIRPRIEKSAEGRQILEAQYKLVMSKKKSVIEEANKEVEYFNAFKIASEHNPSLTYKEFIETINT